MSTDATPQPRAAEQLLAGDGLRALAALSVVVYHYAYNAALMNGHFGFVGAYGPVADRLLGGLELGLYVFFVLSGYLIAGPWVRAYVEGRPLPSATRYARNRLLRLVPPFWVVFTVLLLVDGTFGAGFRDLAVVYLFGQSYVHWAPVHGLVGPAWTLGIELAFYALVPIVAVLLLRLRGARGTDVGRARAVVLGAAAVWAASIACKLLAPEQFGWQRAFPMLLFAFMPGVALSALETRLARARPEGAARRQAALVLLAGVVLLGLYVATSKAGVPPRKGLMPPVLASLGCACVVAAPMLLQWSRVAVPRVLRARPVLWVGERSYGIYLIHQGMLATLVKWLDLGGDLVPLLLLSLAVGLPATLAAAAALFALVERPLMRRRLPWRRADVPGTVSEHPTVPAG